MNYKILLAIFLSGGMNYIFGDYIKEIYRDEDGLLTGIVMRNNGTEAKFDFQKLQQDIAANPVKMSEWVVELLHYADRISGLNASRYNSDYWRDKPVVINKHSGPIAFRIYSFINSLPEGTVNVGSRGDAQNGYSYYRHKNFQPL